jgi:hypothetical protein
MSYREIDIPGGSTKFDDSPQVHIAAKSGEFATLTLTYISGVSRDGQPPPLANITFTGVIEYRWMHYMYHYLNGDGIGRFRLMEIINSEYVEEIAANSPWRRYSGRRFGPSVRESEVKHFRLAFDDYGIFDIIASDVSIREVTRSV